MSLHAHKVQHYAKLILLSGVKRMTQAAIGRNTHFSITSVSPLLITYASVGQENNFVIAGLVDN
jgi:hypothetical protein